MLGSRDAFLLAFHPEVATIAWKSHLLVDRALDSDRNNKDLAAAAVNAHKSIDRKAGESRVSAKRFAELATAVGIAVPAFDATPEWPAKARQAVEPAIRGSGPELGYRVGAVAGALTCTLEVLDRVFYLHSNARSNAWLADQRDSMLSTMNEQIAQLRALEFAGAADVLRHLDERPDLLDTLHTYMQARIDWAHANAERVSQLGHRFVNEPVPVTGPPGADECELVAAILQNPEDDRLRERYGQLATARNDPRGKLVELQLTARDLRRTGIHPGYGELLRQASSLIAAHPEWSDDVVRFHVGAVFHRGFVEEIECDLATFLARAAELYTVAPILHVRLHGVGGHGDQLAAFPQLARIQSLWLQDDGISDADIAALAASAYLGRLRWLELFRNRVTDAGIDALAASRQLPVLAYVGVDNNPCHDPADEQFWFNETQFGWEPSERGRALEAKYGRIKWLHPSMIEGWPPPIAVL